ncbi:hypothetical protein [Pedobacter sp. UYP1]|uniref:hypothetical protein n=1 Tax=Pedobacter sp. UYP1 TaxID=1756396 RepID=UPI003396E56A
MMIIDLQSAILEWFWFEQDKYKTIFKIEKRCKDLFHQFYPNQPVSNAKYQLFYPLVRYGMIEFYGAGKFALSPTCALVSANFILLINLPTTLRRSLDEINSFSEPFLGYVRYPFSKPLLQAIKNKKINCEEFDMGIMLRKLPSLVSLIKTWEKENVIDPTPFLFFDGKWGKYPGETYLGVFKKSDLAYSQRVCRLGPDEWRVIPEQTQHIDAFSIAVLWSKTHCAKTIGASYITKTSKLVLTETFFPLAVERLLSINTMLNRIDSSAMTKRNYHVNQHHFRLLNHFLSNSIESTYE